MFTPIAGAAKFSFFKNLSFFLQLFISFLLCTTHILFGWLKEKKLLFFQSWQPLLLLVWSASMASSTSLPEATSAMASTASRVASP